MRGFLRSDGRKGIRNQLLVVYLVECAHHVVREIATPFKERGVQVIGFSGCYPNKYAGDMLERLCTHPNVGGALLVSLGCESFNRHSLVRAIQDSGRPVHTLVIQESGGTRSTIASGQAWIVKTLLQLEHTPSVPFSFQDLTVGTICGGSDSFSGITGNPSVGKACDRLVDEGSCVIFEETGEMIGCEQHLASRAETPELAQAILMCMQKTANTYTTLGHASFAVGNADGGLTTIEEKSLGAYSKSGSRPIRGLIKPAELPLQSGLYLLDVIPDGDVRFGFPNINDNAEIAELMACGAHVIIFVTGRGSVVGSPIAPVIKVCANPNTYRNMQDDMDVNAGRIVEDGSSLDEVGNEIVDVIARVAEGAQTASEALGHQEFVLTYKTFTPSGPECFPG